MPNTTRMAIPYPAQFTEDWWATFILLSQAIDGHHFASFEDRNLFFTGGGTWTWDATSGLLEWDGTLRLNTPSTGLPQDLTTGSLTLEDGECMVVDVTRGATSAVALAAAADNTLDPDDAVVALCFRSGTKLYFRNGVVLTDGATYDVFETGTFSARPVDQRDTFTATAGQVLFTLSATPDADCIVDVYEQGVLMDEGAGDDYQISGAAVTFNAAVTLGHRVTIRYWI